MTASTDIRGRKGGESEARTPVEQADNLRSIAKAKILLALGEGEFDGGLTGRNIYLDGTPLEDANGNSNFPGVRWEFRPGSQHQGYIKGMPAVENEVSQSVELTSSTPYVRAVTNTQLSAVRLRFKWPFLQQQQSNGDVVGYKIQYAIDVQTDGGAYQTVLSTAVSGKTTSGYERSHRINLPPAASGWQIRVRRLTANQNSGSVQDTMQVVAFTEIIDSKLRYPSTALLYVEFDAAQFTNIPSVACEPRMRIIQVPSNYDPDSRTYAGSWDGTFKSEWTDNPAWVAYDIITNARFGLGRRIKASMVDKWELYRIAQYCDQRVPDGQGGLEPRYTCNLYIQSKAEAWTVLRDLAAIYRGMTYWAHGQMISIADMPRDVDFIYTRANVIDGKFTYGSSSERTRYTRALVSFDNPANGYESDVTAVFDLALQRRYGDNVLELSAIGCTRESEAQRRGKWALLTNSKDRTVEFQVGLDGNLPLPGHVIGVADPLLAGRAIGGRISSAAGAQVTLDRDAAVKPGDRLIINLPSGKAEGRTVLSVAGRAVTVTAAYSEPPAAQLQWSVDADDLAIQQFRVTSIRRDEPHLFTISATQHDPDKFDRIDTGARIESRPITVIPPSVQAPPTGVAISSHTAIDQGLAVTTMTISWAAAGGAVGYDVEWQRDNGDWVRIPRTGATSVDVVGIYAGQYLARVRAINPVDVASVAASSSLTYLAGKEGAPPAPAFLAADPALFGIDLRWGFPAGAGDTERTEIQYNAVPDEVGAAHLGDYAYPQRTHSITGLAAGVVRWFRARLIDRTGNVGPWTAWTYGQASSDAGPILDALAGQIRESELAQALADKINAPAVDLGPVYAAIDTEQQARQDADSALAGQVQTVAAQAGDAAAAAELVQQAQADLEGNLSALTTIKTQTTVNGQTVLAGLAIGVEGEEQTSQILALAQRFAIVDEVSGQLITPFVVQGGQVFINEALIGTATIQQALIGSTLESVATDAQGNPLVRINLQTGEFVLRSSSAGGSTVITNQVVEVFDSNGTRRVRMGIWT